MKKASFLLLYCLILNTLTAQKPKLVVGIVIDQMRYDYLEKFKSGFGKGGFNRLLSQGRNYSQCHINYFPTYTAPGHASIYTGTTPAVHGIVANEWFERKTNDTMYCVSDNSVQTIGSTTSAGMMSPKNLYSTTMTDQLKLSTNFKGKVVSICIKDRGSILPGGHHPDECYWFDNKVGKWITSTYYAQELPSWVQNFNNKNLPEVLINQTWNTFFPISKYTQSTADDVPYESPLTKKELKPVFPHRLSEIRENNEYGLLLKTPFGNTLTRLMVQDALKNIDLGKDTITDFLAVSFSSTDYVGHHFGINAIELEDTYYRLDRELDSLFQSLDKSVGKDNYIVFLTADHGCAHNPQYLIDNHMNAGFFKEHQMLDSLNQVLDKTYKQEKLIKYVENQQIYLDDALIASANLNKESIIQTISEAIKYFEGIEGIVTANQIINNQILGALFDTHYQKGFRKERCGDIYYKLLPGWMIMPRPTGTTHGSPYDYDTHIPFLLMGPQVKAGVDGQSVNITDIAPTICNLLGIQLPDGCTGKNVYDKK